MTPEEKAKWEGERARDRAQLEAQQERRHRNWEENERIWRREYEERMKEKEAVLTITTVPERPTALQSMAIGCASACATTVVLEALLYLIRGH